MTSNRRSQKAGAVTARSRSMQRMVRRWRRTEKELPPVNEKFGESEFLLCIERDMGSCPFVGWYNAKTKAWYVAHHSADSIARSVSFWMALPKTPNDPSSETAEGGAAPARRALREEQEP